MVVTKVVFKPKMVTYCIECDKALYKNSWKRFPSLKAMVKTFIEQAVRVPEGVPYDISFDTKQLEAKPGTKKTIKIVLYTGKKPKREKHLLKIIVYFTYCPRCSKKTSTGYQGILQIRNLKEERAAEVINYVRTVVDKVKKKGIFINKEAAVRNGFDFYVSSQTYLRNLGLKVHQEFGGELQMNPQLFSRDKQASKNLYRLNVKLRLFEFSNGDIIRSDDKLFIVASFKGSMINALNIETGLKKSIDTKKKQVCLAVAKEDFVKTTISRIRPALEVLSPIDFQSTLVANPDFAKDKKFIVGRKIKIAVYDGQLYLV